MMNSIQLFMICIMILSASHAYASKPVDNAPLLGSQASRASSPEYFRDDMSRSERALLERIQRQSSQRSVGLDSIAEYTDEEPEVSVLVTDDQGRADCQSPFFSRSDSAETLNNNLRSGAKRPSLDITDQKQNEYRPSAFQLAQDLTLQDLELDERK